MTIFIDDPNSKEFEDSLKWLKNKSMLALDTETNGLSPYTNKVLLLQVGDQERQYVYDTYRVKSRMKELLNILNEGTKYKIIHNAQFDYKMIKGSFGVKLNNLICTYLIERLLTKGKNVSASLKAVTKKYLNIELDKDEQKSFIDMKWGSRFSVDQLKYAGVDIAYLLAIFEKQKALIKEKSLGNLVNLELEALPVIADISLNGIYLNKELWLKLEDTAKEDLKVLESALREFFADYKKVENEDSLFTGYETPINVNFDSPLQVKKAFTEHLKLKIESTEAKYLMSLPISHPAIDLLIKYKKAQKLITTYGTKFLENINELTGRIHSNFRQADTETGRMSSDDPNLQNIPRLQAYRTPFQVEDPENYRMISADFSGQELRLLAQISGEEKFIDAIKEGKDIHSYSASLLYGIPYKDFLEYDENGNVVMDGDEPKIKKEMKAKYRNPCKTITFG